MAASQYSLLGDLYYRMCEFSKAERYLEKSYKATRFMISAPGMDQTAGFDQVLIKHANIELCLANCYTDLGKFDQAEQVFKETITHHELLAQKNAMALSFELINCYVCYARMFLKKQDYKTTKAILDKARNLIDKYRKQGQANVYDRIEAVYFDVEADFLCEQKEFVEAKVKYQKAINLLKMFGEKRKVKEIEEKIEKIIRK